MPVATGVSGAKGAGASLQDHSAAERSQGFFIWLSGLCVKKTRISEEEKEAWFRWYAEIHRGTQV